MLKSTRSIALVVALSTITSSVIAAPVAPATQPATIVAVKGNRVIAMAPLSTLGNDSTDAATASLIKDLQAAFAAQPGVTVVSADDVLAAIKKAKRPQLRSCDGDAHCLATLGALVGADGIVFGELGGLGAAQVVYLSLINVKSASEERSTNFQVGHDATAVSDDGGALGAAVRLFDPEHYVGKLALTIDVTGASVFINGTLIGKSPVPPQSLPVGTHALRITHPEFHDFVRFVDIKFDKTEALTADLQGFPVIRTDLNSPVADGHSSSTALLAEPPWYRRWWAVTAFGVLLIGATAIAVGAATDGLHYDYSRPVGAP